MTGDRVSSPASRPTGAEGVPAFRREPGFVCVAASSGAPYGLPVHTALLPAGGPVEGGVPGPDQTVRPAV